MLDVDALLAQRALNILLAMPAWRAHADPHQGHLDDVDGADACRPRRARGLTLCLQHVHAAGRTRRGGR